GGRCRPARRGRAEENSHGAANMPSKGIPKAASLAASQRAWRWYIREIAGMDEPIERRAALARKIFTTSNLKGRFRLRSGAVSDEYFDKYLFESDPVLLREIAEAMRAAIPSDTDALAGLEMGGIPIATVLSQITGLPTLFVRKQ